MMERSPGLVQPTIEAYYGFAAEAAEAAISEAALAALASLDAAGAGAIAAGGVVSAAGAGGASVLLPQALRTTAAAKAHRASLVFIYRYPKNIYGLNGHSDTGSSWAYAKRSFRILEGFTRFSYLFRRTLTPINVAGRRSGVSAL
jgi:hypothetical protein